MVQVSVILNDDGFLLINLNTDIFYTFTTIDDHSVSITGSHNIVVAVLDINKTIFLPASQVTFEHHLVMPGRTIGLRNITRARFTGFYSPLTFTGYLLVNNLSTSVYVNR